MFVLLKYVAITEAILVALIRRGGINPRCERQIPIDLIIIQADCLNTGFIAVTEVDHQLRIKHLKVFILSNNNISTT